MTVTRQPLHKGKDRFTVEDSFWRAAEQLLRGAAVQGEKYRCHIQEQVARPIRAQVLSVVTATSLLYALDWQQTSETKLWKVTSQQKKTTLLALQKSSHFNIVNKKHDRYCWVVEISNLHRQRLRHVKLMSDSTICSLSKAFNNISSKLPSISLKIPCHFEMSVHGFIDFTGVYI